jgi:hypothetical protein
MFKSILLSLLLLVGSAVAQTGRPCSPGATVTPTIGLLIPQHGCSDWDTIYNNDFVAIDTYMSSHAGGSGTWGSITGTLSNQTDLQSALDAKANIATTLAGYGITDGVATSRTINGKALSSNITLGLASADFANQGTTTTVLHGNGAGNPSFGSVVSADLNITPTSCTNQFVSAISAGGVGTCATVSLASAVSGQLPISNVGSAGLSGTSPVTISAAGAIGCATCTTNASALNSNSIVLGGGSQASKVVAGIVTDGTSKITLGVSTTSVGAIAFNNLTSGTITIQPVTGALGSSVLSLPIATTTLIGATASDTTTSHVLHATATGFVGTFSAIVAADLPAALSSSTSINGLGITASTGTLTITNAKTLSVSNTLTLAGTDSTVMTFPTTSATIARTDAANTFTGHQTIEGVTSTGATGTALLVFGTSPTLTTPRITEVKDGNGNVFLLSSATASAVDSLTITNAATANPATVSITASGADSNINLNLIPKGTGVLNLGSTSASMSTAGILSLTGSGAGFIAFQQAAENCAANQPATSACFEAPAAITSYKALVPAAGPTNSNSAWLFSNANPSVGSFAKMQQTAITTSAYTNATTSFTTVTGGNTLQFSVEANTNYVAECQIMWQGSAGTTGPKFQWTGPASPTAVAATLVSAVTATTTLYASATAFSSALADTGTITTATNFLAALTLGVVNGANAGTVTLQAAANGTGTLTIQPGSYCTLQ